jgi:molecular chaperone DnaJ
VAIRAFEFVGIRDKRMSKRDYYDILGVNKSASLDEIKKAYRNLAMQFHPDRVPAERKKEAEERFKEISEAYAVLSDSQKRGLYDQYGHSGIDQKYTHEDIFKGADFSSIFEGLADFGFGGGLFEELFGDAGVSGFGGGRRSRRGSRGRDIQYEVDITLEEAASGVEKTIKVPRHELCDTCGGSGTKPGTKKTICPQCKGSGQVVMSGGFFRMAQTCGRCGGEGKIITQPCPTCKGQGQVRVTRNIQVKIPPGVDSNSHLRIRGEGEVGTAGKGDLYILIGVAAHPVFKREGNDIYTEVPISFVKAALGGEVSVPTLNGNVKMKIPAGTQSGRIFRLRGKGMPDLHSMARGDELLRVMIQVPENLTTEQKRILVEYARASREEVDEGSFGDKIKRAFR